MLVLSRHHGEKIMIGEGIVITVIDIRADKVRIGIEADPSIPVHRLEVYQAIRREQARADSGGTPKPPKTLVRKREREGYLR